MAVIPVSQYTTRESCEAARLYWSSTQGLCFSSHDDYLQYVEENNIVNPEGAGTFLESDPEYTVDLLEENSNYGYTHGIAGAVFDAFEIEYKSRRSSNSEKSGALEGLDIKSVDAMSVVKAGLTEALASRLYNYPIDIAVDPEDGKVEFFEIGKYSGNVNDIYQVIQSESYLQQVAGAVVQGKTPLPYRRIENRLDMLKDRWIFNMTLYNTNCILAEQYDLEATIVYKDPLYIYNDLWYSNGWGTLAGHIHSFKGPSSDKVVVQFDSSAVIPIEVSRGFPSEVHVVRPDDAATIPTSPQEAACLYTDAFAGAANTLLVKPPTGVREKNTRQGDQNTFDGLRDIVLVGRAIHGSKENPLDCSGDPDNDGGIVVALRPSPELTVIKLTPGQHYAVTNEEEGARVVFISDIPGYLIYGADTQYRDLYRNITETADVFPLGDGKAMRVDGTHAVLQLSLPSIRVTARETGALIAAEQIKYYVSNLVTYSEPGPVAINGELIDMTDMQPHRAISNPINYITNYDRAMSNLDVGRSLQVNLATLGEDDCEYLSSVLYELMVADDGVQTEYICGPLCAPLLGGVGPGGGIVNSISYKYQDEASYLVYVSEGAMLIENPAGSPNYKMLATETLSLTGKVISKPNGGTVKVHVEKFGNYKCLIMAPMYLRVGDIVNVTIYNYPKEVA